MCFSRNFGNTFLCKVLRLWKRSLSDNSDTCLNYLSRQTFLDSYKLRFELAFLSKIDGFCFFLPGSDAELSSDGESDRSATSRGNGTQFRNTLNKAKTLCDKLRSSGGIGSNHRLSLDGDQLNQGKLSRWFSIRRGSAHQYDVENADNKIPLSAAKMPLLPEVEEESVFGFGAQQRRQVPPTLPPAPPNLSPQQLKRRMIVAAIVHSENSYVATLQRLVNVSGFGAQKLFFFYQNLFFL